jgi:Poly(ADP-ribose) polymerase catalytic domain/WGR domain
MKLDKNTYPKGHGPNDFLAFGPPAIKDGEFESAKIADLGCFAQGEVDSNKFYTAAVLKSKINNIWYCYFEWGRTGKTPTFQFVECSSESQAQEEFVDQLMSKNVKRGEWTTVAGIKTLKAKPGKDCYLVRNLVSRTINITDAKNITTVQSSSSSAKIVTASKSSSLDPETESLLRDLNSGTVSFARSSMSSGILPAQSAIEEAREVLIEAQKRIKKVGDDIKNQSKDKDLLDLTNFIYSRIPKIKPVNQGIETWILSSNNIFSWNQDLDAYESALSSNTVSTSSGVDYSLPGVDISHIDKNSELGQFLYKWWPSATANKHSYLGAMKIKNMWKINRKNEENRILDTVKKFNGVKPTPVPFEADRKDLDDNTKQIYNQNNVKLLFHGTRTINGLSILKSGFRLPKDLVGVAINGRMWGDGAYYAPNWQKSAGYCSLKNSYWARGDGQIKNRSAFMFACDVAVGNSHIPNSPTGFSKPPNNNHSVWAKPKISQVENDEIIVYNDSQIAIKYLLEFDA